MLCLIAEQGPDAGQIFVARGNCAVIGQNGEIALNDRSVSAYHAIIQAQDNGRVTVTDLNSENGTWLGYGERSVEQITLKSGMCFRVGNTVLRIQPNKAIADYPVQVLPMPRPRTAELHLARPNAPHLDTEVFVPTVSLTTKKSKVEPSIRIAVHPAVNAPRPAALELEFNAEFLAASERNQPEQINLQESERLVIPLPALKPSLPTSFNYGPSPFAPVSDLPYLIQTQTQTSLPPALPQTPGLPEQASNRQYLPPAPFALPLSGSETASLSYREENGLTNYLLFLIIGVLLLALLFVILFGVVWL